MNEKDKASTIITNATILTMDKHLSIIDKGAVAIKKDIIIAVDETETILNNYQADEVIDATDCIVIPGLINCHSHVPMAYFKGVADDLPLETWLNKYIWPLESKFIVPDFVFDSAMHGAAEMVKNGITLTKDMYFHGSEIANAISKVGLRGMIGEAIVDFKLIENGGYEQIGKFAVQMERAYKNNPLINFTISPHAIYTCSTRTLERCVRMALDNNLLMQIHLSETEQEVKDCQNAHNRYPVQYLMDIDMLKAKLVIAHGIWVSEDEMELLAEHNVSVAICTESNLKLAAGFAPIKAYLKHKVRCCFATDGVASNNNLDLLAEMDFTAKLHKTLNNDPTFLPAKQILAMATSEAAKALHRFDELGSLETGKKADIVVLDCNSIEGLPVYNPYSQVVYALGGRAVRDVVINGETVLRHKKLTKVNESDIIAKAKEHARLIKKELR